MGGFSRGHFQKLVTCMSWPLHWPYTGVWGPWFTPFAFILEGQQPREELCSLSKDVPWVTGSQNWVSFLTPVLPHTLAALSQVELYFISHPTASLGSFPNQYAVGFSLPFS